MIRAFNAFVHLFAHWCTKATMDKRWQDSKAKRDALKI